MGNRFRVYVFSLLAVLLLAGCQKEDSLLSLKTASHYLDADGSSVFLAVGATWEWTLTLEFPDGDGGWARVEPASGSGSKADVFLHFDANPSTDVRRVNVVLKQAKGPGSKSLLLTQNGKTDHGSSSKGKYGYDVADGIDWLELPATQAGDGLEVLIHNMQGGAYKGSAASGVRNFSCYWDYDNHLSLWVAYPLNDALRGSGKRSDAWGFDPLLPAGIQPDLTDGSYGLGWTRGHQLPSADRLTSYATNASTYVPTNLTPQDYDFNAGIWGDLEGKVRNYASKADTMYVVTGCLYQNATVTTSRNSGFYVKVPTHYFKALLYSGRSSYAKNTEGYMMAGFILPHDNAIYKGDCMAYICSIDELEKQTGIDFFPNLEKKLGKELPAQLEAATPNSSFWD